MKHIISIVLLAAALTLVSPPRSLADDTNRTAVAQVLDTLSGSVLQKDEMSAAMVRTQTLDWVGAESPHQGCLIILFFLNQSVDTIVLSATAFITKVFASTSLMSCQTIPKMASA